MALVEGGNFQCYIHDYETANISDWNEHCLNTEGHTEEGTTTCTRCGVQVQFSGLPFHPIKEDGSKGIQLMCEDCSSQTHGNVQVKKINKK
jgi:hypothetical protein